MEKKFLSLKKSKKKYGILLSLVLGSALCYFYFHGFSFFPWGEERHFDVVRPLQADDKMGSNGKDQNGDAKLCRKTFIYSITKESLISGDSEFLKSKSHQMNFTGQVSVSVAAFFSNGQHLMRYQWEESKLMTDQRPLKNFKKQRELYALTSAEGKIESWLAKGNTRTKNSHSNNEDEWRIFADILGKMQYVVDRKKGNSRQYTIQENDINGVVIAHYEQRDSRNIIKSRMAFLKTWNGGQVPQLTSSYGEYFLDEQAFVKRFDLLETLVNKFGPQSVLTKDVLRGRLTAIKSTDVAKASSCQLTSLENTIAALQLSPLNWELTFSAVELPLAEQKKILDLDITILFAVLKNSKNVNNKEIIFQTMNNLVKYIELQPSALEEVFTEIKKNANQPEYERNLIGALSSVDLPQAHKTLREVMEFMKEEGHRELFHFTMRSHLNMRNPDSESVRLMMDWLLEDQRGEDGKVALLSATSVGPGLEPFLAQELNQLALNGLQQSTSRAEEKQFDLYLTAIGNLGHPSAFPHLVNYALGRQEQKAGWAIDSMRHIPGEAVDRFLLTIAKSNNKSVGLRQQAVSTLKIRYVDDGIVKEMIELYQSPIDQSLKVTCLDSLASETMRFWPRTHQFLMELAKNKNEISEEERKVLRETQEY